MCDLKWDCPGGTDETCNNATGRYCPGQFKCADSIICLAIQNTCDKFKDCHNGDDELFCDPFIPECPPGCNCLGYIVYCKNITVPFKKAQGLYPYILVSIVDADLFISRMSHWLDPWRAC